jgi:CNT family concentrative nucleoside transporter
MSTPVILTEPVPPRPATPLRLRAAILAGCALLVGLAYALQGRVDPRVQAAVGVVFFIALVAAFSDDLAAVSWRIVGYGLGLQIVLALVILKLEIAGVRPGYVLFEAIGRGVKRFLEFTDAGSLFVFGGLADPAAMGKVFPGGFVFAFRALPTIIFVSSFFTVLYYFGILQFVVKVMARAMIGVLRTSGAETLSAAANVFMGQTEAPLIVKPYVPTMTRSELLAMMVGGMATISGGVMAVYISLGADPIAILTTSVMAAPCSLYLAKILVPEREQPLTRGEVTLVVERTHANAVDAAAAGASDGTALAINVAAMLIAFLAFIALIDFLLGFAGLSLARVFGWVFAPVAVLMGVPAGDVPLVADLLGTKLVANEFVSYVKLTTEYKDLLSPRSFSLATFALTGFANIGSIGIQLGGIGGLAPTRRADLARLGWRALLAGFVATLVNASIASILL